MHFQAFVLTALAGLAASATIGERATTCFDNGDCILAGGTCVKASGQITGTCSGKATTSSATGTASAPTASATGATCFDDGDCFLSGGKCVKTGTGLSGITGHCSK